MLMLALMVPVFYLFFVRPQLQRQKKQKLFQESLAKGQKIVTNGGIHGRVLQINENAGTVLLEVGNAKMTIERSAISQEMSMANTEEKKK